ncbi:hypothetical protein PT7_P051 (plasmid) [Pusillimonas sp. T7-7]|uniref:hypothetical protein n=1 Tax=Pusillimonas sp. (strain T7-7) TaxID=1007105 RepID=UPI0002084BC0|nr:hypothetical protein [Pusillimonas sp. T7-7]AEC22287.1 hypothetical protein PT7_P051 [Pusillimonas sp. T7-7]
MAEVIVPAGRECAGCGTWKPYSEFNKKASGKDGHDSRCIPCKKISKREEYLRNREKRLATVKAYREANPEKASEAKRVARGKKIDQYRAREKEYYENNKERAKAWYREYRVANIERLTEASRAYKKKNAKELSRKQCDRQRYDLMTRLRNDIRGRINIAIRKNGYTKKSRTTDMVGCDWQELKRHLEKQFSKGMSWANRGQWHIDHIVPLASAKDEAELLKLCHHTNLRPMWARDNLIKGSSIEYLL